MLNIKPPDAVIRIIQTLEASGHRALLAGGCVRDALLGFEPKDWDIATDAAPEAVQSLFEKTVAVGAQFGVVLVRMGDREF
ncbi:MAG: CCA tRNA nucleotidyltransferase, partial [Nitrospinae bacterium]|nr:CCA tRNA nucleotidyltransferase [Nitrospinota bacterium]